MNGKKSHERILRNIGNIRAGRPHLGVSTSVESYRLLQNSLRTVLEDERGGEETDALFRTAGKQVGRQLFERYFMGHVASMEDVFSRLQGLFHELNMGIVRIEEFQPETLYIVLTISEDLGCSGLPEMGERLCAYEEGVLAGILESFSHKPFEVREIDCWCSGDNICRFIARMLP